MLHNMAGIGSWHAIAGFTVASTTKQVYAPRHVA